MDLACGRQDFLFVRPEDLEASAEVDRTLLAEQLSEVESLGGFPAAEADVCPACGAQRPEDAEQCPSCELGFLWPAEEETGAEGSKLPNEPRRRGAGDP